ncbi:MAG: hypothetical protein GF400_07375 [Candidatus Eisenbacteria bacterium]|nr:hypothetical protein [Candidatus Eisenbacteria bacterium]
MNELTQQLRERGLEAEAAVASDAIHVKNLPEVPVLPGSEFDPESTE